MRKVLFLFQLLVLTGLLLSEEQQSYKNLEIKLDNEVSTLNSKIEILSNKIDAYNKLVIENDKTNTEKYLNELDSFTKITDHFFKIITILGIIISAIAAFLTWLGFANISNVKESFSNKFKTEMEKEKDNLINSFNKKLEDFYIQKEDEFQEFKDQIITNTQLMIETNTNELFKNKNTDNSIEMINTTKEKLKDLQDQVNFINKFGKDNSDTRRSQGLIYLNQNELNKALIEFNRSLELNPNNHNSYFDRARLYRLMNKNDLAIKDYEKTIELNPGSSAAYNNLGIIYIKKAMYNEANHYYELAIEKNPKSKTAYKNLIELNIFLKDFEKANEWINKILDLKFCEEDELIILYFKILINILNNESIVELENKLDSIINKNIKTTWSFDEIEIWLNNGNCLPDQKENIEKINKKLLKSTIEN